MRLIIDIDNNDYELINKTGVTLDLNTVFHGKEKDKEMTLAIFDLVKTLKNGTPYEEKPHNEWNNHTVACLLADLFGDPCACNFCGIDEWLPKKCDFANKECPDVVGVACWEQFLKHRKGGAT